MQSTGFQALGLQQFWHIGTVVAVLGLQGLSSGDARLSSPKAHRIFPDQGS